MVTGVKVMVIREGDRVIWFDRKAGRYANGRVIGALYGGADVVPDGRNLYESLRVDLIDLRVRVPRIRNFDVVVISTPDGRAGTARQGVVCPALLGWSGWHKVEWEDGMISRHRPQDLLRVPVGQQTLWALNRAQH